MNNNILTTEQALKMQVNSAYAFEENEREKAKENYDIYNAIKHLAEKEYVGSSYACSKYKVTETTDIKLTDSQKALIADSGNLCFGYRTEGNIIVIYKAILSKDEDM